MSQLLQLPDWLCGVIIIGGFVLIAVAGLPLFQWLTAGRLHLTEAMNNDIVFFAEAIAVFYSLTVGLIAVGGMDDLHPGREHGFGRGNSYRLLLS